MAKKDLKPISEVLKKELSMEQDMAKKVEMTHQALSMVDNGNDTYSVVRIGFNPTENAVSSTIEVVETNTDKFIIQERLSILLLEADI